MGTSAPEDGTDPDGIVADPHSSPRLGDLQSIGVLGGTFNPPHLGHLAVARSARASLGLERVLMMPACISPVKPAAQDPGPEHRLNMCRLLVEGIDGLSACALEIERGGPSYTVDTLSAIQASHPDAHLTFITGADTACTLPAWRSPAKLLELAELAVAARDGSRRQYVLDVLAALRPARRPTANGDGPVVRFLEMTAIDISSSMARERAARGEPIDDLVGSAVAGYIAEHGLYRPRTAVAS